MENIDIHIYKTATHFFRDSVPAIGNSIVFFHMLRDPLFNRHSLTLNALFTISGFRIFAYFVHNNCETNLIDL